MVILWIKLYLLFMNILDLFSGCGGLTEGFHQEGFKSVLHVDFDQPACETLRERLIDFKYKDEEINDGVLCGDLTNIETQKKIDSLVGNKKIDVLVGGPPCQSFSSVGRAQDKNSMRNDPRNYLFKAYLEVLEKYMPKIFVFENVSGLLSAKPGGNLIFPEIIKEMSEHYDVCDEKETILLNSAHYGVPQVRKRVIIIGVRKDLNFKSKDVYKKIIKTHYCPEMEKKGEIGNLKKYITVKEAIGDLPKLKPGEGSEIIKYKKTSLNSYVSKIRKNSTNVIYNHFARNHNSKDIERYYYLSKNEWQLKDLAIERPDLIHHDPKHFGNRYTVQYFNKPGKTVVAHLYKDGNLFIHPDHKQSRTFTVREAARIQSFPDDFKFVGSRTNQFKQVGNAVPPLMAKQIAKAIKYFLI